MTLSPPDASRRNEGSRRAILAATVDLIRELGYEQTSIEGIARRAGVGKQTIYRWWPSKGAVALEALEDTLGTVIDFRDSGDLLEDLRHHMKRVTQLIISSRILPVIQGLIAAAQSDPVLASAHLASVIEPSAAVWRERIARAQDSGEIRADADPQAVVDMLFGSLWYRMVLHTRALDAQQIDDVLLIAFGGLRPSAHDGQRAALPRGRAARGPGSEAPRGSSSRRPPAARGR